MQTRSELERTIQQLYLQLEELGAAIKILQDRSLLISNEIREIRMAYETLQTIQRLNSTNIMSSLDRYGYVYVKVRLDDTSKAIVRISRDFYAVVPIDIAKNILLSYEKDLQDDLRKIEADIKHLMNIYNQLQNKLQEQISILTKEEERQK